MIAASTSDLTCMIEPIKPARAEDPEGHFKKARYTGGTGRYYLMGRIRRDCPEIWEQWQAAGYDCSVRQLAIRAGILPEIAPEDAALEKLLVAWKRADVETREVFLFLIEDWEELPGRRRGPRARITKEAPAVLVKLAAKMPMNDLAKAVGVSRETVRRWCAGQCQPSPKTLALMQALAEESGS